MVTVFHQAPLCEFLALMPILRGIKAQHGKLNVIAPWSRAHLSSQLIGASPMDIELFEFTRLHAAGGPSRVSPAVADTLSDATTILSYVSDGRDDWAKNVARLAPNAEILFLEPRPDGLPERHITEALLAPIMQSRLNATVAFAKPRVAYDGPILIHPGSTTPAKCWPRDRYEALIVRLKDQGKDVLPVLGEVEAQRWPETAISKWKDELGATLCQTADSLMRVIAAANLVVGNDAAPTHLGSEMGVPSLSLFGPSNAARWAPRGPGSAVLSPPDGPGKMDWLDVDTVFKAVTKES